MIEAIADVFGDVISIIYGFVPNFGVAIIILTLMVKLITFPLNNKQIQTTRRMQKLQPEIKKIQQKYKDDKQKQNQVMSEYMKENNMNPLAGCLPLLVQFPFLIGIFRLLREPVIVEEKIGEAFSPFLFPSADFVNLLTLPSELYVDTATLISQLTINFGDYGVYYLFPIIAGGTTYLYSKMSMPADSSQKMMLYLMPGMITVFSFGFPIGLVIYWTMNNIFSLAQHKLVNYLDNQKKEQNAILQTDDYADVKTKEVNDIEHNEDSRDRKKPQSSTKRSEIKDGKTKKKKKGKGKK